MAVFGFTLYNIIKPTIVRIIPKMKAFHQRYMCSNKVIRLWVNMVRQMDIDMIVPQHGTAFVGKEMINQFLDWIEGLECGVDLMNEYVFSIPAEIS